MKTKLEKTDLEAIVSLIEEAADLVEELPLCYDHACMWCGYDCEIREAIFHLGMAKAVIWDLYCGR